MTVQYASEDAELPSRPQLRRWVKAALIDKTSAATVTIRFVDANEGRQLNREFRGKGKDKDYATNVLSFPYDPLPDLTGDLVICAPVVRHEAIEQDKSALAHFTHLVVHGMLHLQGYDHEADAEAMLMEAKEREILARLGVADPY